ncbi:restriction endonuclease subunit S [Actinoalloteichus hymeniacidonis]|uniref:restriction endonuclease subunit S n=1 Tax=Actinoalloteichus hymeniacidonis TaxID=340345 RepID=UPI000AF1F68C|nr:restriction endonuclease subunit S [Actinoalloteichus hymeniacidonis]
MELPAGWVWAQLGELGEYINGRGFKKSEWSDSGRPIIRIQNLTGSGQKFNYYADELQERHKVNSGDLLISWAATLGAHIWRGPEAALNQHIFKVRPFIDKYFLFYLLEYKINELLASSHGSGMIHITRPKFDQLQVAIPPLSEQRRIVEALETHNSRIVAATGDLISAQSRFEVLKRSAILQTTSGARSTQNQDHEPATELLTRIANELERTPNAKRRKDVRPAPLSPRVNLPSHWRIAPLGALTRNIEYGTSAKASSDPTEPNIAVLRMGNIQDGRLDLRELKYLPRSHPDSSKLLLADGDLLFNRTNSPELVGKSAVYHSAMGPATFASYLIRCQFAHGVEPEWVSLCINSPVGRQYIRSVAAQQVGQANVNSTKLASFPIPIPPHSEQIELLKEFHMWKDQVDRTTKIAQRALTQSKALRQSLLTRAFTGSLVAQDPADEPASLLLHRIRIEREVQDAKPRTIRKRRKTSTTAPTSRVSSAASSSISLASTTAVQQELPL